MENLQRFIEYVEEKIGHVARDIQYGDAIVIYCQPVAFAIPLDYKALQRIALRYGFEVLSVVFLPFSRWPMRIYLRGVGNGH